MQFNTTMNSTSAMYFITASPPEISDQLWREPSSVNVITTNPANLHSRKWMSPTFFMAQNIPYGPVLKASRTNDIDALVYAILNAKKFIYLSVMDFLPASEYSRLPFFWGTLFDALLTAVSGRSVQVRLLISRWAHTSAHVIPYLKALKNAGNACHFHFGDSETYKGCSDTATLSVRIFEVPGWNDTGVFPAAFPTYTRVNHAKYIVTDERVNIGTSNYEFSYFAQTAGTSFNSDFLPLREQAANIFMRDWNSTYSTDIDDPQFQ